MMLFSLEIMVNRAPECTGPSIRNYVKTTQERYCNALDRITTILDQSLIVSLLGLHTNG